MAFVFCLSPSRCMSSGFWFFYLFGVLTASLRVCLRTWWWGWNAHHTHKETTSFPNQSYQAFRTRFTSAHQPQFKWRRKRDRIPNGKKPFDLFVCRPPCFFSLLHFLVVLKNHENQDDRGAHFCVVEETKWQDVILFTWSGGSLVLLRCRSIGHDGGRRDEMRATRK